MVRGDHSAATIELKGVLQRAPEDAEARFMLGTVFLEQALFPAALVELKKAKEAGFDDEQLTPKHARVLVSLGRSKELQETYSDTKLKANAAQAELNTALAISMIDQGRKADAERLLEEALKLAPTFPWALVIRARILASDGRFDDALALLDRAIAAGDSTGEPQLLQGAILYSAKRDEAGAAKAYLAATKYPRSALGARGAILMSNVLKGDLKAAKAELELLRKSHPKSLDVLYFEASIAYAEKDFGRVETLCDQMLRVLPDSAKLLVLAGATSMQRGALISAETRLGKAVQLAENPVLARKLLAETYLRLGQPDKAIATVRPLIDRDQPDAHAQAVAGQAYLQKGAIREAESMFEAANKAIPGDSQIRTALALTDLLKGNSDAAFSALTSIAAADAGDTADMALISARLRRNEFDQALEAIAALDKKQPGRASPKYLRGTVLLRKGDEPAARLAFEEALKAEPLHYASVAELSKLDFEQGKLDASKVRLEAAIQGNPKNTAARMALVGVLAKQGAKTAELVAVVDAAMKASPDDPAPRVAKISLFSRAGDTPAMVAAAHDALGAMPTRPEVLDAAGLALATSGDDQQAISAFSKLAALLPRAPEPHFRMADVYGKRGEVSAAGKSLQRALEIAPQSKEAMSRLISHAVRSKDYGPALESARMLKEKHPELAVGYVLQGDAEASRKAWSAAVAAYRAGLKKVDPLGRPQTRLHAVLIKSGDKAGANAFQADWLKASPQDAAFRDHLASIALVGGSLSQAERLYREVTALQPKASTSWNNLAWVLAERNDPGAVAAAQRAMQLSPGDPTVMDTFAKALAVAGRLEEAITWQRRALLLDPTRQDFRIQYVGLLVKAGKRAEAGQELSQITVAPNDEGGRRQVDKLRLAVSQ